MEDCIPIINKLQNVFGAAGLDSIKLPQIVVVGSQSSGKSSVLESLVGKDFLPRGNGIVTRCPLVLQLVHTDIDQEYGEFIHRPGERFYDFSEIREEIKAETVRLTGSSGKIVSRKEIQLMIKSPQVLDLTLVDLPGLTKLPVGDQPANISMLLRELALEYISSKHSIILAVSAANADIANSDGLEIAKEVDPQGVRTLGVLTKLDLMDEGTDATELLEGKVLPLRLGFVGVVNRSQRDIDCNVSMKDALKAENEFFDGHLKYHSFKHQLGIQYLGKRMNKLLVKHIRSVLPGLKQTIEKKLLERERKLEVLGELPSSASKGAVVLQILSSFSSAFSDLIDGKLHFAELNGGARISLVFHQTFMQRIRDLDPFDGLEDDAIRMAIQNAKGPRPSLFVPEVSFELLVKRQIGKLLAPSLECVDLVFQELLRIAEQSEHEKLKRFQILYRKVSDTVVDLLRKCLLPTQQRVKDILKCELAYINTNHPDFISGTKAVSDSLRREEDGEGILGEREHVEMVIIKSLIKSYFEIVCKNVSDAVPKAIMAFLVNASREELQSELVRELYKEEQFDTLLQEAPRIKEERNSCEKVVKELQKAIKILAQMKEYNVFE